MKRNIEMKKEIESFPEKNTVKDYVAIRVVAVHVKKGWLGYRDKILGFHIAIPDTPQKADELMGKIEKLMNEYGVSIPVK